VEVASFQQSTSNELIRCCDQFIAISGEVLFKDERFVRERREREIEESGLAHEGEDDDRGNVRPPSSCEYTRDV
jgi:hypothetical protein